MTVIAWDGKTLAADRQVSDDHDFDSYTTKISTSKDGSVAGALCGSFTELSKFETWVRGGARGRYEFASGNNSEALLVHSNGNIELVTSNGRRKIEGVKFYAMGGGRAYALGALEMGATAAEAVRVAMKYICSTGDIDEIEFK